MLSLRPGAVNFEEKWSGLKETILAVVQLQRVDMATWNDNYSDIYALCEAYPTSYSDKLYLETRSLLEKFLSDLHRVIELATHLI